MTGHTPDLRIGRDLADVVWKAANYFVEQAAAAIAARGAFHVALSGGTTPLPMYALLAFDEWRVRLDWTKVHAYFSDERCVPPDSAQSNYRMAYDALLRPCGVPEAHIHRIRGEIDPHEAAAEYDALLANQPLDLILLGMGDDGHTASLFPGGAALHETARRVVAEYVMHVEMWRVTFTPHLINAGRAVAFLAAGERKAAPLKAVLTGDYQPEVYPAQAVKPQSGQLVWFVDEAAAALVK